jgi:hypothetical protein
MLHIHASSCQAVHILFKILVVHSHLAPQEILVFLDVVSFLAQAIQDTWRQSTENELDMLNDAKPTANKKKNIGGDSLQRLSFLRVYLD